MKTSLILLTALITSLPAWAEVRVRTNNPAAVATHQWKWITQSEANGEELYSLIKIQLPSGITTDRVKFKNQSRLVSAKDSSLEFLMPDTTETLEGLSLPDSGAGLTVTLDSLDRQIEEKGCSTAGLFLTAVTRLPKSAYIGISCSAAANNTLNFVITVPTSVNWGSASIFENAGKGERWHSYSTELMVKLLEDKTLGDLTFDTNSANFRVKLIRRRNAASGENAAKWKKYAETLKKRMEEMSQKLQKKEEKERPPLFTVRAGAGMGTLSISSPDTTASNFQPLIFFNGKSPSFVGNLKIGADFKYALQLGTANDQGFNSIYAFLAHPFGQSFEIEPHAGLSSLGVDHPASGISFRNNTLSMGLNFRKPLRSGASLWLDAQLSGYLPSGDSQFIGVGLGYKFKTFFSLGAYSLSTTYLPDNAKFSQILALAIFQY